MICCRPRLLVVGCAAAGVMLVEALFLSGRDLALVSVVRVGFGRTAGGLFGLSGCIEQYKNAHSTKEKIQV